MILEMYTYIYIYTWTAWPPLYLIPGSAPGHDAFIHRPPPTPAPSLAGSLRATHQQRHYVEQQITARLSILILSKIYPSVITTSPTLDMIGFWPLRFLLLKSNKEYVRTQNWQVSSDRSDLWAPPVRLVWLKSTKSYLDFTIG
jgi:hypothetical protein